MDGDWTGAIERARAHSPFLSQAMERQPEIMEMISAGNGEGALAAARSAGDGEGDVGRALRHERSALALALGLGDLAGAFPLSQVTGELSAFADRALDAAIAEAVLRRAPEGSEPEGFLALALGKHGARELNYSSDIDPILLYDPDCFPRRERDEPGEAAQRVARWVVETLSQPTAEGYVFRVDLALRPASEVSPLAISIDAALTHYESSALAWERAAFIRARACAGDIAAGEDFLAAIRPFVWRKSLDFGAIAEVGRLTRQIRASHKGTGAVGPGFDLKRGRGGIREIEFFAQTHQLIHGGRNPALRCLGTRETLDALASAGLVSYDNAQLLGDSYDRLRTIEHRLQMVHDRQTHTLPEDAGAMDNVARLDGLTEGAALVREVTEISEAVGALYDALIDASPGGAPDRALPAASEELSGELEEFGFDDGDAMAERVASWRSGKFRTLRSDAARSAFEAVEPELLEALAKAPEPERAVTRWEQLLGGLPSAINLFHLLEARPALLELLGQVLSLAPPLADELARRADLLDPLIDATAFDLPGTVGELIDRLGSFEADSTYEEILDSVRRKVSELRFALGVQLLRGASDPLEIGAALARVAEAALSVLTSAAVAEFQKSHGTIPGCELVILGLGRLGGGVLTHASDLDLVFLFSGNHEGESGGGRPLGATHYYNRLGQRVISALSVPTAEGALYEVDTRLRPSGEQGPPAASFKSFALYQKEEAWTWEHMALCRSRPMFGSDAARTELERIIDEALHQNRDPERLRKDVLEMRATMAEHKPGKGPLDVKLSRGGLVDLEFLVHYLQLREGAAFNPDLGAAIGILSADGLLPVSLAQAHDDLTRFLIAARLLAHDSQAPPAAARMALARACNCRDWDEVLETLARARQDVAAAWQETFGEQLEIET